MTIKLSDFINQKKYEKHAKEAGDLMHKKLQFITIDTVTESGNMDLVNKIKSVQGLSDFFGKHSKTEVPIAGNIQNNFISRRIDRMIVIPENKIVKFIDYKTDIDKNNMYEKYIKQLSEYKQLLSEIYPNYIISGYILWTHDWQLERII